jgi:hypothetical protein
LIGSPAIAAEAPAKLMPPTAICVRIAFEIAVFARLLLLRPVANSETATHDPVDSFQTDLYDLFIAMHLYKNKKIALRLGRDIDRPLYEMQSVLGLPLDARRSLPLSEISH